MDVLIEQPPGEVLDVLLIFRGTLRDDTRLLQGARNALTRFKGLLDRKDLLLISVAYPEENLLFGDNIREAEAALLWTKTSAAAELGVQIGKIVLAGHSQGGYLVTRLNTLHETDGVIANAPGPLDLAFRCALEENGQVPAEMECSLLRATFGPTTQNEDEYLARSLLSFSSGFKSKILFIQGLNDSPIQMRSWPIFQERVQACTDCAEVTFLNLPGLGHIALFESAQARQAFNAFFAR
ncbi:alpha/beta hydrolase family protein [Nitritalea halalkaliphila]|uniref:alpha/beta hydrolase family protein n=1 Tax=Nitritalea halalkaliphila TaxID=590849 RepID=UPI0002F78583|nr:hypothetical protein [Nitritalea halalkaliphila]